MNRRKFIALSTVSTCTFSMTRFSSKTLQSDPGKIPGWLVELIKTNDKGLESLLGYQITDQTDINFGGVKDYQDILNPHSTAAIIQAGACSLFSDSSEFYNSARVIDALAAAAGYLVKTQHSDGTIDLLSTNFHSTPDTGFLVKRLSNSYSLLSKANPPGVEKILVPLKKFLQKGGEALISGGIHTPNHRWVVSAALTKLNGLWPDPRYVERAEQWLGEHLDIDADGQFNEKSTFIYSPLTDRLLITIAKGLNKPEIFDAVRKNLSMTMFYMHPNGEIVTEASGRQDKAIVGTLENYYYPYRYMALKDGNGEFAAMCKRIEETAGQKIRGSLDYLLDDHTLWRPLPASKALPVSYAKPFPNSGLVRIRRNNWDSTIIAKNAVWLTYMNGSAVLQGIRFASSFFGKGQFKSEKINEEGNRWVLTQKLEGPYYQPYPKASISPDGDWEKMPRENRPQSEIQVLETTVTIREMDKGLEIEISSKGTDRVPVAIELIFRQGGVLAGVVKADPDKDQWLLKEGTGTYTSGSDTITFGPGTALHKNIALRGSLPAMDAPTVYLTGFTPFQHTLKIS
ncbi:hypothetical protein DYBT9275_03248 [Dyadobacter sp. CECT 9275]|uniref:Uncharacterized protein n=1 Tax=Dyadobacter helix TaxID=2822344 RepID=A0A916N577_9BACT|nr:hypothetical protein [Dyadobacter sp. CECT 9275]CAG5003874.1 hypothetical protein DYBT9275_03248 [Dyadobacter sp. CECT 9275]